MFNVLICINNHIIIYIDYMLSGTSSYGHSPFICRHLGVKSLAKGLIVLGDPMLDKLSKLSTKTMIVTEDVE